MKIEMNVSSFANCYEGADLKNTLIWQEALLEVLKENEIIVPAWQEDSSYHEAKAIDEAGLASLALCAAYTEAKKTVPTKLKSVWDEDKVYTKAANSNDSKYKQLLRSVDIFLPGDFPYNFEFADMNDEVMLFGSLDELISECERLKRAAFKEGSAMNQVMTMAEEALNLYLEMAKLAKANNLPLFIN